MIKFYRNNQEIINYLIFGILTTLVSIVSYYIFDLIFDLKNDVLFILANILSWILAVSFAFITNKKYVFKKQGKKISEFILFVFSRILTLLLEIIGMYLMVKVFYINNIISKIIMQIIVIVANYFISKLVVFKR